MPGNVTSPGVTAQASGAQALASNALPIGTRIHEFEITRQNTALVLSYTTSTADLTDLGGPADQKVINGVVQEIDIRTGTVLFEWNSADHIPYSESRQPLPASASATMSSPESPAFICCQCAPASLVTASAAGLALDCVCSFSGTGTWPMPSSPLGNTAGV